MMNQMTMLSFLFLSFVCYMHIQSANSKCCAHKHQNEDGCWGCGPCNIFCCNCDRGCCTKRKRDLLTSPARAFSNDTQYFHSLDLNGNAVIDYPEFVKFIATINKSDNGRRLNETAKQHEFNKMDKDKDGKIQRREFSDDLDL